MWWFLRPLEEPHERVQWEDARAARRAEAADPWRGRDRLRCAWRERNASVLVRC
jgi:hypothetical protein